MFVTTYSALMMFVSVVACAMTVGNCLKSSRLVGEIRSLRSLQGEIAEIDACVGSLITTIRRMEGRQTANLRRNSPESAGQVATLPLSPSMMDKDQLRRYAGLLPGKRPPHQEVQNGNDRDTA
jgi:hypothetical protein